MRVDPTTRVEVEIGQLWKLQRTLEDVVEAHHRDDGHRMYSPRSGEVMPLVSNVQHEFCVRGQCRVLTGMIRGLRRSLAEIEKELGETDAD